MHRLTKKTEGEERLRLALEAAEMGYWEWHPQTNQVIWSEQTAMVFGFAPGAFKGNFEAFIEIVHPEDRATLQQEINHTIEQHTEYRPEYRIVRPCGEVRWLSSRGRAYYDDAGKVAIMLGVVRDITERKQQEAERTRLIAEAQMACETAEAANRGEGRIHCADHARSALPVPMHSRLDKGVRSRKAMNNYRDAWHHEQSAENKAMIEDC